MMYIIMSESFIKIEPLQHLSLSLGLINWIVVIIKEKKSLFEKQKQLSIHMN